MPDSFKDEPVRCVILERTRVAANRIRYLPPLEEEQLVEFYDFDRATNSAIEVHGVLNQFVHSYHLRFIGAMNGSDVVVLVASDKSRNRRLLAFWLSDIARLLERAALLEASRVENTWDERRQDWVKTAPAGEFFRRLIGWGWIDEAEYEAAMQRATSGGTRAELAAELALIAEHIRISRDRA